MVIHQSFTNLNVNLFLNPHTAPFEGAKDVKSMVKYELFQCWDMMGSSSPSSSFRSQKVPKYFRCTKKNCDVTNFFYFYFSTYISSIHFFFKISRIFFIFLILSKIFIIEFDVWKWYFFINNTMYVFIWFYFPSICIVLNLIQDQ